MRQNATTRDRTIKIAAVGVNHGTAARGEESASDDLERQGGTMSEQNPGIEQVEEEAGQESEQERMFTQEELDKAISDRLKRDRKKHADELAKFADYDELKAKAEKLDEIEAASKTELEKTIEAMNAASKRANDAEARVAALEAKAEHDAIVAKVASEEGVLAELLKGDDEDELRASAQAIKAYVEAQKPKVPETKAGGATPAPDDESKLSEREEYAFRVR